jgi:hypothetical protein
VYNTTSTDLTAVLDSEIIVSFSVTFSFCAFLRLCLVFFPYLSSYNCALARLSAGFRIGGGYWDGEKT